MGNIRLSWAIKKPKDADTIEQIEAGGIYPCRRGKGFMMGRCSKWKV